MSEEPVWRYKWQDSVFGKTVYGCLAIQKASLTSATLNEGRWSQDIALRISIPLATDSITGWVSQAV
ncbi:hypothetical protein Y032_0002g1034 [Ancylostoma ceylanicum]|uniref:Uncharacterized protein n=1 Tax=Ancylostoma ceylanicum TaxID=53326 RepID=A0A016W073_9BILA|nr:hypothetical protein Y032_0002g1034 [Ancylostoma ceylanicum]